MALNKTAAQAAQILVTKNARLLRIMRHEFHEGNVFNPKLPTDYLGTLLPAQVRLLQSYPKDKYKGKPRLVIFITKDPNIEKLELPMCAVELNKYEKITSNCHFAVFHCDGTTQSKQNISLVCYTREFCLDLHPPKKFELQNAQSPTLYKISAMNMSGVSSGEGDTVWNRISLVEKDDKGVAIYGGESVLNPKTQKMEGRAPNAMHGMINTKGCWMLFRNYNWYKEKQKQFLEIYLKYARNKYNYESVDGDLQGLYGEPEKRDRKLRFEDLERNYAYMWFTYDVMGVKYFSHDPSVNETNIDDSKKLDIFPVPTFSSHPANSHSWGSRHSAVPSFEMTDDLWQKNALGFQAAEQFAPFTGHEVKNLEKRSWADVYFYQWSPSDSSGKV